MRGTLTLVLCLCLVMSSCAQHMHGGTDAANSTMAVAPHPCVTNPTEANCSTYKYPHSMAVSDLVSLCTAMSFMPGCSVARQCNTTGASPDAIAAGTADSSRVSKNNANVCRVFNHVATVCRHDTGMSKMKGCTNYNTMCTSGSLVPQCSDFQGFTTIPSTEKVNAQVRSICEEMTMDGCELCTPDWKNGKKFSSCDLLSVYGSLCYQMPEMSQCSDWKSMCQNDPTLWVCTGAGQASTQSGSSRSAPVMKMYFFDEMPFYLLFKSWIPRDNGDLVGAWFAIFFLAVFYELLQVGRMQLEAKWASQASQDQARDVEAGQGGKEEGKKAGSEAAGTTGGILAPLRRPLSPKLLVHDLLRAVLQFIIAGISYLLMLAAMSYHVAIFFAVITGIAFGTFLFGRWRTPIGLLTSDRCCA